MTLQPPATLLIGSPGSGKTDALTTYIEAGLDLFVIITEPGGVESLLDSCSRRNLPVDRLHFTSCLPAVANWSALDDMARVIGSSSFEDIQNIKSGVGKTETRKAAMAFLSALKDFHCERTGVAFGDTSTWGSDRALCWDSMSGIAMMSMALTIGYKPAAHQGEWGVAMNFIEQLLLKGTSDRRCFFTLTAHVEKEMNEISGVTELMVSTLGRKLAPKIPRFFSEVVFAKRELDARNEPRFTWSTVERNMALKNRALSISNSLTPSFVPIVQAYQRRIQLAGLSPSPAIIAGFAGDTPLTKPTMVPPVAPLTVKSATRT